MFIRSLIIFLVIVPVLTFAQDATPDSGQEPQTAALPASLTTNMPELRIGSADRGDHISVGFSATTVYDDNVLASRSNRTGDLEYLLAPTIEFRETRQQVRWDVRYGAGVAAFQNGTLGRQANHAFTGSLDWAITKRFNLALRQDYTRSSNAFTAVDSPLPPLGIVNSPNQTIVAPASVRSSLTSEAELGYAVSRYGKLGVSGTFFKTDYSDVANGVSGNSFMPGQTTTGSGYYSHQYGRNQSIGIQYVFADMTYTSSPDRVQTHSGLGFLSFGFGTNSTLTLYAGPEYTKSSNVLGLGQSGPLFLIRDSGLSPAFGGNYSWVTPRSAFGLSAMRRVSDGGGMMQAVTATSGTLSLSRQLTRRLAVRSDCTVGHNESLDIFRAQGSIKSLIASIDFTRQLSDDFSLNLGYSRVYQDGTGTSQLLGNHNLVRFSLRYSFTRSLGK